MSTYTLIQADGSELALQVLDIEEGETVDADLLQPPGAYEAFLLGTGEPRADVLRLTVQLLALTEAQALLLLGQVYDFARAAVQLVHGSDVAVWTADSTTDWTADSTTAWTSDISEILWVWDLDGVQSRQVRGTNDGLRWEAVLELVPASAGIDPSAAPLVPVSGASTSSDVLLTEGGDTLTTEYAETIGP